ncbi:MAG: putative ABC transporter permease [Ruminococcus callidus]
MQSKLQTIEKLFLYFLMAAIIGWCYEVFLEVVVYRWGFQNRGVLFGPYCPVYESACWHFCSALENLQKCNYHGVYVGQDQF